jgi:hypothetical protein
MKEMDYSLASSSNVSDGIFVCLIIVGYSSS